MKGENSKRKMKNHECPHIGECKRYVIEHDFIWKCLGKISWNHENCFKSKTIGTEDIRRLPIEWWGIKLIERGERAGLLKKKE
jgi:hypothetical protein